MADRPNHPALPGWNIPEEKNRDLRGHDFYPSAQTLRAMRQRQSGPFGNQVVHLHYYGPGRMDWYLTEVDQDGIGFGWCRITDGEWGSVWLPDLEEVAIQGLYVIERDLSFRPKPAREIAAIGHP